MVWTVIGWMLLGLLALFVLFLVVPIVITVQYAGRDFLLRVRVLGVPITIFPMKPHKAKEKKSKPKKEKAKAAKPKREKPKKPPKTLQQQVVFFKRLAEASLRAVTVFVRHLRIYKVRLVLPVHAQDAADTAVRCGQLQMAVGAVRAALDGRLYVKFKQIQLIPDFAGLRGDETHFSCKLAFCPCIIFPMGFVFLRRYLQRRPYSKAVYKRALAEKNARRQAAQNAEKTAA